MEDKALNSLLEQIVRALVRIDTHLEALARVARAEHPEAFKPPQATATVHRDRP